MLEKCLMFVLALGVMGVLGLLYLVLEKFQHWFCDWWDRYARAKYNERRHWERIVEKENRRINELYFKKERYKK